ncbi:MAG: peptide chain release factor N(5)-glutamine methyltransferase [Saprospiraceae bacterium]|nr:peptide chain release factor N(5)-glutamine methyltransferase [Saprospiraceae bacterium]
MPTEHTSYPAWLEGALRELKSGKPVQYVTGVAHFYGHQLIVTPATLIPRPETEELTDMAIRWLKVHPLRHAILEVGTGSGCIAISIAKACPDRKIVAWDHSDGPLEVARQNARLLEANLSFQKCDALKTESWQAVEALDLLISNPPYIAENEREQMGADVLAFEPHDALFAPGPDPLIFYRTLAVQGVQKLNPGGKVMMECSTYTAGQVGQIFENAGYLDVIIHQDLQGLDRILSATWSN